MTLTELKYLVAVGKERHFGKAADVCCVSQPTLSISIKKLEEELGIVIFDRSSSEIKITPIGEEIISQAKKTLAEVNVIYTISKQNHDELDGLFKLGIIFTVAPYLLPKMILELRSIAPKMYLLLEENYTATLTPMLKNAELDAIIVAEPYEEKGVETIPLYDEPFYVIVPKGHAFEQHDYIDIKVLLKEKILLLTEGNCLRDQIIDSCAKLASQQNIPNLSNTIQGSSINTVRHMVASGLAISILPSTSLTDNDHTLFSIIPFQSPAPTRRVILAYRKNYLKQKTIRGIEKSVKTSSLIGINFVNTN